MKTFIYRVFFFCSFLFIFIPLDLVAQNNFFRTYSITGNGFMGFPLQEPGRCVRQLSTGDYLVMGISGDNLSLIKLDVSGTLIWNRLYTYAGHSFHAEQFIETSNGDILMVGSAYDPVFSVHHTVAIRVDLNGAVIWSKLYQDGPIAFSVTETAAGNFALVGTGMTLFIIDGVGNVISSYGKRVFTGIYNGLDDIETTSDGGLIMTGQPIGPIGSYDVALIKTDSNGNLIWQKFYGGTDHDWGGAGVVETPDGGYIVSGSTESFGVNPGVSADMFMIKTDSLGNLLWSKTYGTGVREMARGCVIAADGGYLMAGYKESAGFDFDILILKTDANGNYEWARTYDHLDDDGASFVDLTNDGGFIFTGGGINSFPWTTDIYVVKTDSMGIISNSCHQTPQITVTSPPTQEVVSTYYADFPIVATNIVVTEQLANPSIQCVCSNINTFGLIDQNVCIGDDINLSIISSGVGPFTYEWLYQGVVIPGANDSTFTVLTAGLNDSGIYTCIVSSACSTDSVDATISVIACGFSLSLPADTICVGECVDLAVTANSASGPVLYEWDQGITDTIGGPINVCPVSTTTYTVIGIDSAGSSDTVMTTITVLPEPNVFLGNDTTFCNGSVLLDAQNVGATYLWQDNSANQTLNVTTTGIYWVQVENGACAASDSINITINNLLVDLGADSTTCTPSMVLDAQSPGATYLWQDNSTNQTFNVTDFGTYWVQVNDGACAAVDTLVIAQDSAFINLPNDTLLCSGSSLLLDAQNPGANYLWSDGSITQTITVSALGTYWVEITEGACYASDTIAIDFYAPHPLFFYSDTIGCSPLITHFTDLSTTSNSVITNWYWTFGDGFDSNVQNPSHEYMSSGVYDVTLTVTTADGCFSLLTQQIQITVPPSPVAAFNFSPSQPMSGELISFVDQSIGALTWNWTFDDGVNSTLQNPTHIYEDIANFEVQLIVSNGECLDSITHLITIQEELVFYVPNAFTPDGDEFNNIFYPVFTSGYDAYDYHLTIFNRWGEVIFESPNSEIGWDGTYGGKLVQDGIYNWKIEFGDINNDERHIIHGHVNMIR